MIDRKLNKDEMKLLRRKAMADDPTALHLMGEFHLAGNQDGLRQDPKRALRYFRRAADAGVAQAQVKAAQVLIGLVDAGDRSAPPLERYMDAAQYAQRAAISGHDQGWTLLEDICKAMTLPTGDEAARRSFSDAATGATPGDEAAADSMVRDLRRLLDNRRSSASRPARAAAGRIRTVSVQ